MHSVVRSSIMQEAGHEACEPVAVPGCSGINQGVKRKRELTDNSPQLVWGLGFIGCPQNKNSDSEEELMSIGGYHSAETEVVADSEDDLSFLNDVNSGHEQLFIQEEEDWGEEIEEFEVDEEEEYEGDDEDDDDEEDNSDDEEDDNDVDDDEEEDEEEEVKERGGEELSHEPMDLCVVCLTRRRNACFLHGNTGHQVCCFECATRLKSERKKCPVCRRKIKMVVKIFF